MGYEGKAEGIIFQKRQNKGKVIAINRCEIVKVGKL
jgi:hypothetical protein